MLTRCGLVVVKPRRDAQRRAGEREGIGWRGYGRVAADDDGTTIAEMPQPAACRGWHRGCLVSVNMSLRSPREPPRMCGTFSRIAGGSCE